MSTEEELAKLKQDALPPGSHIWVGHFFSHPGSTYEQHKAFHDALRSGGFGTSHRAFDGTEIGADEELEGRGYWHHWAFTLLEADEQALRDADTRAGEIAANHGVRYDRWTVDRNPLTGEPRSAERT